MTTTANIQTNGITANQDSSNMTEEGTMNHAANNIDLVSRLSNIFRTENISKLMATAAVGLALAIGVAMPSSASADVPTVINVGSQLASNWNDDFSLVFGTPDASAKVKLASISGPYNDDFSMVFGLGLDLGGTNNNANAKLTLRTISGPYNDDFSLVFGTPDAPAKVKLASISGPWNDDASLVFGTPDDVA